MLVGGMEITYGGDPESVLFSGGLEDDQAGYSAALLLSMAMMHMPGEKHAQPGSCTVASTGLMVGAPDPMEGFPAGIRFSLFGFARNAGTAPLILHGLINYMGKAGPRSVALPVSRWRQGKRSI